MNLDGKIEVTFETDHLVYFVDCTDALIEKHGLGAALGAIAYSVVRLCRGQKNPAMCLKLCLDLIRYVYQDLKKNPKQYPRL